MARRTVSIFLINEVIHYKRSFSHNINYTLNHSLVSLPSKTKGLLTSESNFNTLIGSIKNVINGNNGASLTREQIEALALAAGASGG